MLMLELMGSLLLVGVTIDQPTKTTEPSGLEAVRAAQERTLAEIDREIVALLVNKEHMDKSGTLKAEEAASLRLRLPAVRVEDTFNTERFIAELRIERQRTLKRLQATLTSMLVANRATACMAITELRQTLAKLHTEREWLQLDANDRLSIRTATETLIEESIKTHEGDPCLPYVESPRDANMDVKMDLRF